MQKRVNQRFSRFPLGNRKRGVSTIVATVLIILIVVAAIAIIWMVILPLLGVNLGGSGGELSIITSEGYTVYDPTTGLASVQIKRGDDDSELKNIEVIFSVEGESVKLIIPGNDTLEPNSAKLYKFDLGGDKPDSVRVVPSFKIGTGPVTANVVITGNAIGDVELRIGNVPREGTIYGIDEDGNTIIINFDAGGTTTWVYQEDSDLYITDDREFHTPTWKDGYSNFGVTYNKYTGAVQAKWKVKYGDEHVASNHVPAGIVEQEILLPDSCFDYYLDKIELRIRIVNINHGMENSYIAPYCYNGTWQEVGPRVTGKMAVSPSLGFNHEGNLYDGNWTTGAMGDVANGWASGEAHMIYEEGMFWKIGGGEEDCGEDCIRENQKNMSLYSDKELFLISDKNWKDVLPFVSASVWTGDELDCQRGYNTPEDVCVYPMLIYHEEENFVPFIDDYISEVKINCGTEGISFKLKLKDSQDNFIAESDSHIPTKNYELHSFTFNTPINKEEMYKIESSGTDHCGFGVGNPYVFGEYSKEPSYDLSMEIFGDDSISIFDIDSSIYFMQQYSPDRVSVIGQTPQGLDNLLVAEPELGAGLSGDQIQRIGVENYLDYWSSYGDVVYVEDDYELALLASTYASLINAPLVIEGSEPVGLDMVGRNVACVGSPTGMSCDEQYGLEELQQKYVEMTDTDKIILVNPNDLDIKVDEVFLPEKSPNPIYEIYSGTSLVAPILASAKQELILTNSLEESIDFTDQMRNNIISSDILIRDKIILYDFNPKYLTIMATPSVIPDSERLFTKSIQSNERLGVDRIYARNPNYPIEKGINQFDSSGNVHRIYYDPGRFVAGQAYYKKFNTNGELLIEEKRFYIPYDSYDSPSELFFQIDSEENLNIILDTLNYGVRYFKLNSNGDVIIPERILGELGNKRILNVGMDNSNNFLITFKGFNYEDLIGFLKVNNQGDILKDYTTICSEKCKSPVSVTDSVGKNHIFSRTGENSGNLRYMILDNNGSVIFDDSSLEFSNNYLAGLDSNNKIHLLFKKDIYSKMVHHRVFDENGLLLDEGTFSINLYLPKLLDMKFDEFNNLDLTVKYYNSQSSPRWQEKYYKVDGDDNIMVVEDIFEELKFDLSGNKYLLGNDGAGIYFKKYLGDQWGGKIYLQEFVGSEFNMNVGRIYGLSISDVSSYVTRSLFYDHLYSGDHNTISVFGDNAGFPMDVQNQPLVIRDSLNGLGYNSICVSKYAVDCDYNDYLIKVLGWEDLVQNRQLFVFMDHGSPGLMVQALDYGNIPPLDLTYIHSASCLNSDFWRWNSKSRLISIRALRQGALGYHGAIGPSWISGYVCQTDKLVDALSQNPESSLGEIDNYIALHCNSKHFDSEFILMGDPTLKLSLIGGYE